MEDIISSDMDPTLVQPKSDDSKAKQEQEEQTRYLLATVLDPAAHERLSRIAMVRPELSKKIGDTLLQMAQSRQLRGPVGEKQLIDLLEAEDAQGKAGAKSSIVFRRKGIDDDLDLDI